MIVALGDVVVDLFALPLGADVATAERFAPCQGGAPANVAVVAARLGAPCRFVGAVGADAHGDRLVADLAGAGVDVSAVVRVAQRTAVTFVHVAPTGARTFLSYRHGGADLALAPAHLARLPAHPLRDAAWLHVASGAFLAEPMASAARAVLADAGARGVHVSLDLNVRRHLWPDVARIRAEVAALAAQASVVKASEEDLAALELPATLAALQALAPGALPVLTLAARGATALVDGHVVSVPSPAVRVVDATGAGDAFVGAMLAALCARGMRPGRAGFADVAAWRDVLGLGCAVGARAVTAVGATEGVRDLGDVARILAAG